MSTGSLNYRTLLPTGTVCGRRWPQAQPARIVSIRHECLLGTSFLSSHSLSPLHMVATSRKTTVVSTQGQKDNRKHPGLLQAKAAREGHSRRQPPLSHPFAARQSILLEDRKGREAHYVTRLADVVRVNRTLSAHEKKGRDLDVGGQCCLGNHPQCITFARLPNPIALSQPHPISWVHDRRNWGMQLLRAAPASALRPHARRSSCPLQSHHYRNEPHHGTNEHMRAVSALRLKDLELDPSVESTQ